MALATSSFLVPVSPVMLTTILLADAFSISAKHFFIASEFPIIVLLKSYFFATSSRNHTMSSFSEAFERAF